MDIETDEMDEPPPATPLSHEMTKGDLDAVNLDWPASGLNVSDCSELSSVYRKASEECARNGDSSSSRAYAMIADVCGFYFRPDQLHSPYGPMIVHGNRRSAIPEDFQGELTEILSEIAVRAKSPVVRARFADVAWLLNKRRFDLGRAAIEAYAEIAREVIGGNLKSHSDLRNNPTGPFTRDLVKRGLQLAAMKSVTRDWEGGACIREVAESLAEISAEQSDPLAVDRWYELALDFAVFEPTDVGVRIDQWLKLHAECSGYGKLELLRLTARAYRQSRAMEDYHRCKLEAVETQVSMATTALSERNSASVAASFISSAIAELQEVPDSRTRRTELMHWLVDVQLGIAEELHSISQEMDLREIIGEMESILEGKCLRDALFLFAQMGNSPAPKDLRDAEIKNIQEHPLSGLFAATYHDRSGKVLYRSPGVGLQGEPNDEALAPGIARSEGIRRAIFVGGDVHTVRRYVNENYHLSDDTFAMLLSNSVFVPRELLMTYSRGFKSFFQGDPVSALFILTPLLEASLKQLLQKAGHLVTTFDNATQTQQDLTISALFDQRREQLNEVLGNSNASDIERVFLQKPGPSIRHEVAHGLLTDSTPYGTDASYACWLIFRLCLIPLFKHIDEFPPDLV